MLPFLPPDVPPNVPAPLTDSAIYGAAITAARDAGMSASYEVRPPDFWWVPFQVEGQTFYAVQHPRHGLWIRGAHQGHADATFDWFPRSKRLRARPLPARVSELLRQTMAQYGDGAGRYQGLTIFPAPKERSALKRAPRPSTSSITAAIREAVRLSDEAEAISAQEAPRLLAPPEGVPAGHHVIVWQPDRFVGSPRFVVVPTLYRRGSWVVHSLLAASPGNRIKPDFEDSFTVLEARTGMAIHHAPTLAEASKLVRALHTVSPDPFPGARLGAEPVEPAPALLSAIYAAVEPFMLKERERHRKILAGRARARAR